jgi:signal transduction histidine kinase
MLRRLLKLPIFRRLSGQAAVLILLLLVSVLAVFGGLAYRLASQSLEKELGKRLVNAASLAALHFSDQDLPVSMPGPEAAKVLRRKLQEVAELSGLERLLLLDLNGRVLVDSLGQADGADPYVYLSLDEEEWLAAQFGEARATTLFQAGDKGGGRYYKSAFAPIKGRSGRVHSILRAEASADFLDDLRGFGLSLLLIALISLVAAMGLAVLLSRPVVEPLQGLIAASRRVAGGDFSVRVPADRPDELGQLASTFNEMSARLGEFVAQRERLAALGQVAAGMAHEIRNPLGAIEGFAGLLEGRLKAGKDKAALSNVRDIRREVGVVDGFIADFLEYARPRPPRLVPCDLGAVVEEALQVAMTAARRRRWPLKRQGLRHLNLSTDASQVRQILVNLVNNAREASPKGGAIELGLEADGAEARLWVRDRGRGIPADALKTLFHPFVTSKPMGTGLGLSIAQALAEGLGGSLKVQSQEGKGATFTLTLPLAGHPEGNHG